MLQELKQAEEVVEIVSLFNEMMTIKAEVMTEGDTYFRAWQPIIERESFLPAAENLAHYIALRHQALWPLQRRLMSKGLSSLGRCESRVIPTLDAVIATLSGLGAIDGAAFPYPSDVDFRQIHDLLAENTNELLGPASNGHPVRIMVTLPNTVADDIDLLREMIHSGMNVARINCAHDSIDIWRAMLDNIRQVEAETGRLCRVLMDLGGPKIRTAEIYRAVKGRIGVGDRLLLTKVIRPDQNNVDPIQISCSHPELLDRLDVGHKVWYDDGKLGLIVVERTAEGARLEVTKSGPKGVKLKEEKGLNFPDTIVPIRSLTEKDLVDLDFVAQEADMVGYSFVQTVEDIDFLIEAIRRRTSRAVGIIAKIETPLAVQNLPELIVNAAGRLPFGIMIARGDLALELGFERLAEMQEEILWLGEASATPVIWATQVLENLAKTGVPSRAEMTDAAMAERAECVMLNKGPYISDAIATLNNIFARMGRHQEKKTARLTPLKSW